MKQVIATTTAPAVIGAYSQAIRAGDLIFVSGQIPLGTNGSELICTDIQGQTIQVMKNLDAILKAAGSDFNQVLKTTIFITDMNNAAQVNEVYKGYFTKEFPAREMIAVKALPLGSLVEISVIASTRL